MPSILRNLLVITIASLATVLTGAQVTPTNSPLAARPGIHVVELRVKNAHTVMSRFTHKGYPVIGVFIHRDLDCEHQSTPTSLTAGAGAALVLSAGWGQVMGTGHPGGGKDPCLAWVTESAVEFDYSAYTSIPANKVLQYAELSYTEREAPACINMVYTQGGFAVDPLRCYTDGAGNHTAKTQGCLTLAVPSQDWVARTPPGVLQTLPGQFQKIGVSAWNVTDLVNHRVDPVRTIPFGYSGPGFGHGFMLVGTLNGTPLAVRSLESHDNTRCASLLSNVRLLLRYEVLPPRTGPMTILK